MKVLVLPMVLNAVLFVTLCHGMDATATTGDDTQAEQLAVQQVGDRLVVTLYTKPQSRPSILGDREIPGTLYWLEVKQRDTGRTYAVWSQYFDVAASWVAHGMPHEFTMAAGRGDKVALAFFGPIVGLWLVEVDATREIDVSQNSEITPGLPLIEAVNEKLPNRSLLHNIRRIRSMTWQDNTWTVRVTAAGGNWEFVRRENAEDWQWRLLQENAVVTP